MGEKREREVEKNGRRGEGKGERARGGEGKGKNLFKENAGVCGATRVLRSGQEFLISLPFSFRAPFLSAPPSPSRLEWGEGLSGWVTKQMKMTRCSALMLLWSLTLEYARPPALLAFIPLALVWADPPPPAPCMGSFGAGADRCSPLLLAPSTDGPPTSSFSQVGRGEVFFLGTLPGRC